MKAPAVFDASLQLFFLEAIAWQGFFALPALQVISFASPCGGNTVDAATTFDGLLELAFLEARAWQ